MIVNIDKVLKFLSAYKTRKEIEKKFKLSNTESYHLVKWLLKAGLIEKISMPVEKKTNRVWYYKSIEK
jgi:predicted transcriptional regulator